MILRALAIGGAGWCLASILLGLKLGLFAWPPPDLLAYVEGGRRLLAGEPLYVVAPLAPLAYLYAPPWAALFAVLSPIPPSMLGIAMTAVELLALRYVVGS